MAAGRRDTPSVETDGGARARYVEVAEQLLAEIESGRYEVGSKLPTEAELCDRFGVSRSTIRQALGEIEHAGLVERRQGSGTMLVGRQRVLRYVLSAASENDLLRYAAETTLVLDGPGIPPEVVDCRRLQLGDPTSWLRWHGVRRPSFDGPSIGLTSIFLPAIYADVMKTFDPAKPSAVFERLVAQFDLVLTHIDQTISATVLDQDEARMLDADPGTPALVVTRRYSSTSGLVEVAENLHPADRFSYELGLERDPSSSERAAWP